MDKRRKPPDRAVQRAERVALYDEISRGQVTLRDAVKRMRALSGLTQAEFAEHRGVSIKVIKEIERGIANPTVNTLNQIGAVFGLEVAFVRKEGLQRE
ncbi:helix-turn-helix domain-containing protein [Duganella sp. FT92W]|uniref:Helix-turn-helix domain-containing protein n=1 Tax=Pseudoduganella rivuli TaxID=2666085 RepID=A0A7X2ILY3_9BURK|nr:helix-turn-helix domain-containing protein [Pseudoduganella rivuli]MRV72281.1 helix-turn-helix domain-containing protein [Pseudoduganella rivuli]